jgi:phage shock protein PspC (stress-responsive transcriptional regulator)
MNKTVSANISGFIFNIEEEAYQRLLKYLKTIQSFYASSEGGQEIVDDIEARIAELFQERLNAGKQVIAMKDIEEVITIMGQPEDYATDFDDDEHIHGSSSGGSSNNNKARRIYRDSDDAMVGGVCSGFSHYLGWDPLILRILLVGAIIFAGTGLIIYLVLWALIPEAKTTAEKLQMKGETVNVENISKKINEEMDNVKDSFKKFSSETQETTKQAGASLSDFFQKLFNGLGSFFEVIGKVLLKVLGVGFLAVGIMFFFGLFGLWFTVDNLVLGYDHITWDVLDDLVFSGSGNLTLVAIGTVMFFLSISGIFFIAGLRMLLNVRTGTKPFFIVLFVFFITSIALSMSGAFGVFRGNLYDAEVRDEIILDDIDSDTLYVQVLSDEYFADQLNYYDRNWLEMLRIEGDEIILGSKVCLGFYASDSAATYLVEIEKESTGRNHSDSFDNAKNISYSSKLHGDTLDLSAILSFPYHDNWHSQSVDIKVNVPEGKTVCLSDNAGRIYWRSHLEGSCLTMKDGEWED